MEREAYNNKINRFFSKLFEYYLVRIAPDEGQREQHPKRWYDNNKYLTEIQTDVIIIHHKGKHGGEYGYFLHVNIPGAAMSITRSNHRGTIDFG